MPEKRRGKKGEPDYHDLPFIKIVVIDKSFAKIAIRMGALEGLRETPGVRTSRKALYGMLGQLSELATE